MPCRQRRLDEQAFDILEGMDGGATPISGQVDGQLAWRAVSKVAIDLEAVTEAASSLADLMPGLLSAMDTAEAAATPHAARVATAAEFATAAARHRNVAMRLQVASAHLVDREAVHLGDSERTPRTWLAKHGGMSHGAASEVFRVAETCERFPLIGAAFFAGEVTVGHVDAISRIIPSRFKGDALADAIEKVLECRTSCWALRRSRRSATSATCAGGLATVSTRMGPPIPLPSRPVCG